MTPDAVRDATHPDNERLANALPLPPTPRPALDVSRSRLRRPRLCLWGLFPIYFHALARVDALRDRAAPLAVVVRVRVGLLVRCGGCSGCPAVVRQPGAWCAFVLSALLLSANWLLYVWAVNHGHVVEASLGYFVTPLVNVMLGTWVLASGRARAVAGGGRGRRGVLWLTLTLGPPAVDRAGPGGVVRQLRPAAQDGAARRARRPGAGDAVLAPLAVVALAAVGAQRGSCSPA